VTGSALIRRRTAHQCDDLIGGHLEIATSSQTLNEPLAPGPATASARRLDQPDNARLNLEFDIRPRHKARTLSHVLGDGDLPFGGNSHDVRLSYHAK
jgi:hypothetical protein